VVATCSYEARLFGVRSAMPSSIAARLCPTAIFIKPRMSRYHEISDQIMAILRQYTPNLLQVSVDEAYMDMNGTQRLLGKPMAIADTIKQVVSEQIGLSLSVGIGANKLIAKIASGHQKPAGLTVVPLGNEADFVLTVPLAKIWGLGTKTQERLARFGIRTVAELRECALPVLCQRFGAASGNCL
jgi:DNA polymerase-4